MARPEDARSRRIIVASDQLVNGEPSILETAARAGWGVMQLPPTRLNDRDAQRWLDGMLDDIAEYIRNGFTVALVAAECDRRAAAVAVLPIPQLILPADRDSSAIEFFHEGEA